MVSATPRPLYLPEIDPVPVKEAGGGGPVPIGTAAEISPQPGFDPVDRLARSDSL